MTIKTQIIDGLASGPSTLPKLAPQAHPVSRYVAARRLESAGLIARVGTVRTKGQHGGLRRVVWRLAATVLCFALIGCGGGSSNHRPNIPTPVIGETGWIIGPIVRGQNYSVGMPATPTPQGEGWTMALPGPGGEVDSVANHSPPSLVGATALVMRYAVTGGGFFASGETNVPGRVGLCIQRRGDNWSGEGKYQQYRLYGQSRPLLVAGEDQSLTASVWTDVKGQVVSQAVVDGVFSDLDNYSVVFGGSFASHGVYTTEPSTFTLTALEVVP